MVDIKVEIISDIVCVWCFIGKRTLEKAISLYQKTYPGGKDDVFSITWRPYYLNQNSFADSVDKSEIAKVKFRDVRPEKMAAMSNRVNQIGRANGINFSFGGKIGSTRDAHRLIYQSQLNASSAVQNQLVEKLFKAYHENEMDISKKDVLKSIAIDAGLEARQVNEWLDLGRGREETDEEARKNRDFITSGVPTFFIQSDHRIDGAQDLQELFEAFIKVKEAESSA